MTRRALVLSFAALPLAARAPRAEEPVFTGAVTQGGLVTGRVAPGSTVEYEGRRLPLLPDGRFLLGFGRDAAAEARIAVTGPDGRRRVYSLAVARRRWPIDRIEGLPPKLVTPGPEELKRIATEAALIRAARARITPEALFDSGFAWPAVARISGVYGSQRILNGEPRAPHLGVDIAAPRGTPAQAPADAIVSLAEPDLYFTGGTTILDHGYGLSSVFAHQEAVLVKVGQRVKQGEAVGRVGATGRATGPHLHWGVYLFATALDPQLLVPPMPAAPAVAGTAP
ncbi:MAG: M23 family metallopeptidase, partial [Rhodospirillaceae bacterium]|nr:M23 family metallopeptidase [Rhodospirillaceae bacterium]